MKKALLAWKMCEKLRRRAMPEHGELRAYIFFMRAYRKYAGLDTGSLVTSGHG